jgi:hypothetical protein
MNAAQQALPSKRSTSLRPTSDIMDAGISTAATATGPAPGAQPAGLFGALAGAKGHGPMSGFQALLAAFFGHQGDDAAAGLLGVDPASQGKIAFALKSDSKAGQMTTDDALNPALEPGAPSDHKATDIAAPEDAATASGLSPDAMALAALFAAPLQKAAPVDETTAKPPADQAASAKDAAVAATALVAAEAPTVDLVAAGLGDTKDAKDAKAATAAGQAAVANGRAKQVEFAEALAATRNGARSAAIKADAAQPGYRPQPAPAAAPDKAEVVLTPDLAQTAADPAGEVEAAQAELAAPAPLLGKDRGPQRATRMETARKDTAVQPLTLAAIDPTAKPTVAVATSAFGVQPPHSDTVDDKPAEPEVAPLKVETTDDAGLAQAPAAASHATPAAAQAATTAARGAPETVASLAAQIIKKAEGRATRFDVELHPADLGRVDVRLEIGAHGRMTASMSFENPHAAAELRGRADELRSALENAGFDVSGGLSFDVAGDRGQGRNQADQQTPDGGGVLRGRAFEAAIASASETASAALAGALSAYQSRVAPGLDIRI